MLFNLALRRPSQTEASYGFAGKRIILVTAPSARKSWGAISRYARSFELVHRFPDVAIVFSVHLNPEFEKLCFPLLQSLNVLAY